METTLTFNFSVQFCSTHVVNQGSHSPNFKPHHFSRLSLPGFWAPGWKKKAISLLNKSKPRAEKRRKFHTHSKEVSSNTPWEWFTGAVKRSNWTETLWICTSSTIVTSVATITASAVAELNLHLRESSQPDETNKNFAWKEIAKECFTRPTILSEDFKVLRQKQVQLPAYSQAAERVMRAKDHWPQEDALAGQNH